LKAGNTAKSEDPPAVLLKRLATNPRAAISGLMRCLRAARRQYHAKSWSAGPTRFEPVASTFGESRSIQLIYERISVAYADLLRE
jgi:hypothetical protein